MHSAIGAFGGSLGPTRPGSSRATDAGAPRRPPPSIPAISALALSAFPHQRHPFATTLPSAFRPPKISGKTAKTARKPPRNAFSSVQRCPRWRVWLAVAVSAVDRPPTAERVDFSIGNPPLSTYSQSLFLHSLSSLFSLFGTVLDPTLLTTKAMQTRRRASSSPCAPWIPDMEINGKCTQHYINLGRELPANKKVWECESFGPLKKCELGKKVHVFMGQQRPFGHSIPASDSLGSSRRRGSRQTDWEK